MRSKPRFLAIVITLGYLFFFAWLCYRIDSQTFFNHDLIKTKDQLILVFTLNPLLIFGLILLIVKAKTVKFNDNYMIVNYWFRSKSIKMKIKDIQGFEWGCLFSAINYKTITLHFIDGKRIKFSDFGYGNFYDLEDYIKNRIGVFKSLESKPTKDEIQNAYEYSKKLDLDQIKQIKFNIYLSWALTFYLIKVFFDHIDNLDKSFVIFFLFWIILIIWTVRKYIVENKRLRKIKSGA